MSSVELAHDEFLAADGTCRRPTEPPRRPSSSPRRSPRKSQQRRAEDGGCCSPRWSCSRGSDRPAVRRERGHLVGPPATAGLPRGGEQVALVRFGPAAPRAPCRRPAGQRRPRRSTRRTAEPFAKSPSARSRGHGQRHPAADRERPSRPSSIEVGTAEVDDTGPRCRSPIWWASSRSAGRTRPRRVRGTTVAEHRLCLCHRRKAASIRSPGSPRRSPRRPAAPVRGPAARRPGRPRQRSSKCSPADGKAAASSPRSGNRAARRIDACDDITGESSARPALMPKGPTSRPWHRPYPAPLKHARLRLGAEPPWTEDLRGMVRPARRTRPRSTTPGRSPDAEERR